MVRLRLQQNRVHVHGRLNTGGFGLRRLGAPDLAAVDGDAGVQCHVLGLEGRHPVACAREPATERRREHTLADARAGKSVLATAFCHTLADARAGSLDHQTRRKRAHRDGDSATATVTFPLFTFSTTNFPPEPCSAAGSATPWTPTNFMGASDGFGTSGTALSVALSQNVSGNPRRFAASTSPISSRLASTLARLFRLLIDSPCSSSTD